jgi:prepilin-type N-terminal cleavage/methylation domain-containing protein
MARRAFTLVEILVVLVLLGIAAAIVAPALIPPARPEATIATVLDATRRVAIRRAESVTVRVATTGAWQVTGDASPAAGTLLAGTLGSPIPASVIVHVSPLGICTVDGPAGAPVDALRCRGLASAGRGAP